MTTHAAGTGLMRYDAEMLKQEGKPVYWDNHEGFRRLLIIGSISLVIGVFFGDKIGWSEIFSWLRGWFPIFMWTSGLATLAICFLVHPRQYSIYPDYLAVEWWYPRRKVIPFNEITELQAWTSVGRKKIIVLSKGEDYDFGFDALAPRRIGVFAQRLEESLNRHRFHAGREPIQIRPERSRRNKNKGQGSEP